jgi:hypothetical protein
MKARRSTVLDLIFLLILVGVIAAGVAIGHLRYRYSPSVEHESAFLRYYSPRPVMESFAFKQDPPSIGDGVGSGAGGKFVTSERTIVLMFAIQTDMGPALMNALNEDMAAQLTRIGSTIISRSGDPARGFHFSYKDGTSVGNVTLLPLSDQARSSNNPPLAEGLKEIRASIVISEKWFPQEPGAVRASLELQ